MFSNDPLGDICTKEEVKFLSEVLFEAWFALDVRNMSTEKRKMYSSIKSKSRGKLSQRLKHLLQP